MSNQTFISKINENISDSLKGFQNSEIYGLAQSMIRGSGEDLQMIPALVDDTGEGTYIGIDNTKSLVIYHKANSISAAEKSNSGYGDSKSDRILTYANTIIVYMDRKVVKMMPDELVMVIQANLPDQVKAPGFKTISIRIQNVVLNSQQVFASEYQGSEFRIPPNASLLAINYQIESVFDKSCFAKCP